MTKEIFSLINSMESSKTIPNYTNSDYGALSNFLDKKLKRSIFKRKNSKILLKDLEYIIRYTNSSNNRWVNYKTFVTTEGFIDELTKSIKYYKFKNYISEILLPLQRFYSFDELYTDDFISELFKLNLNSSLYEYIYNNISERRKNDFIKIAIKEKANIIPYLEKDNKITFNIVRKNIDQILNDSKTSLYELRDYAKNDSALNKRVNSFINQNIDVAIKDMIKRIDIREDVKYNKSFHEILKLIVLDICKNERVKLSSIKFSDNGEYSMICFIGNKVLKIGKKRETETFPNNPCIVKPLLRKKFTFDNEDFFVEVTEKVNTIVKPDINDLYELYKKIRNYGLIWTDINIDNVGFLFKDNIIYWNRQLNPSDETLGLEKNVDEETIYKAGDVILMDADFIYSEEKVDKDTSNLFFNSLFEILFQAEIKDLIDLLDNKKEEECDRIISECGFRKEYVKKYILKNKGDDK